VKVLLDTCTLSELRLPKPDAGVARAVQALDSDDLFVSAITIGEIVKGVALLPDGHKKRLLETWLQTLERHYGDRILPIDLEICRMWGDLTAAAQKTGHTIPACDGLIAATARRHGLYVMTRNTADFEASGVLLLDPWGQA
jgi:predicted nucleic acid-binding protein